MLDLTIPGVYLLVMGGIVVIAALLACLMPDDEKSVDYPWDEQ